MKLPPSFLNSRPLLRLSRNGSLLLGFTLALHVSPVQAANGTWINPSGGAWTDSGNWAGGTIADASGQTAFFNTLDLSSAIVLTLGGNRTIGNLNFGDTVPSNQGWSLSGNTLTLAGGTPTVTVGNLGTGTTTISSIIAGTAGLQKTGTGALVLTGNNTFTGATTIRGGQLVLDYANGGRLSSNSLVFGTSTTPGFIGAQAGGGVFILKGGSGSDSVNLGSLTINAGQTKIRVDSGTAGVDTVNFNSGVTRGSGGVFQIDLRSTSGGPDGQLRITGEAAINTALGPNVTTGNGVGYGGMSVTDSGGTGFLTAALVSGETYSIQKYTAYTANTALSGSDVADDYFTAANNYKIEAQSTPLALTTGTREFASLLIDTSAASGSLNLGVTLTNSGNGSGIILSGSNHYEISGGANQLVGSYLQLSAFGGGTLTVSAALNATRAGISGDGVVVLSNPGNTIPTGGSAVFQIFDGGTLSISATGNLGGADRTVYFDAGTLRTTQSGTLTLTGAMGTGQNGATFDVTQGTGVLSLSGVISQSGPLTKTGIGTLQLNGANTYTGTTEVRQGTLRYGANNVISSGPVWINGGSLNLQTFSDTVGAVTLTSGSIIGSGTLSGTSFTVQSGTVSANLAGSSVVLTKNTAGIATLSGTNTYTGSTVINAGTLLVNGSLNAASAVQVADGANLGGHGSVGAISGAGLVSPGNSPGILTALSVDGTLGMDFAFEITALTPVYGSASASLNDVLRLTDATPFITALGASNTVTVDFSTLTLEVGQTYTGGFYTNAIVDFASSISGANFVFTGTNGFQIHVSTVSQTATFFGESPVNGWVTQFDVIAIPEPSTTALLTVGLIYLRFRRRSRA